MNSPIATTLAAMTLATAPFNAALGAESAPTIVLVHGAFVDGSGWAGVHDILVRQGYPVLVVQNPTTSLEDDVAATRRAIGGAEGEVVLVGHSYGGVVITEAGNHPRVSALVYVAAFAPDAGESVASILASAPPGAPELPVVPPTEGFLVLDKARFPAVFAADVPVDAARFMADSQVPWSVQALEGKVGVPAWKTRPSWYLVTQDDRVIPAPAQQAMAGRAGATIRATPGSHAVYVANPGIVAELIKEAVAGTRDRNASGSHAGPASTTGLPRASGAAMP